MEFKVYKEEKKINVLDLFSNPEKIKESLKLEKPSKTLTMTPALPNSPLNHASSSTSTHEKYI